MARYGCFPVLSSETNPGATYFAGMADNSITRCKTYLLKPTAWLQVKAELIGKAEVSDKLGHALEEAANEMK